MSGTPDQVELSELVFTQSWEDPVSDIKALDGIVGKTVMSITSGGCNSLGFLRHDPKVIYAVDINPVQSWVMDLKVAAMRALDHAEFVAFLGLKPAPDRAKVYAALRGQLQPAAAEFWDQRADIVAAGFLGKGKFEQYTQRTGKMMRMLQGRKRVAGLFVEKSAEAQAAYFDQRWNTWRLRTAFKLLYSKRRLAKRGLIDDYFMFDDGSKSFAENFYNRHRNVMRHIPIIGNYFVSLYLNGHYRNPAEVPDYLRAAHYDVIRSRLDRLHNITADAKVWLAAQPESSIDAFSLSNICELMSPDDTRRTFEGVLHAGRNGGRACFRNLMIPRQVPEDMQAQIVRYVEKSKELVQKDRSFVYSRVDQLEVRK